LIRFASVASLALAVAAQAFAFSTIGETRISALPSEARETIALIRKGGPFPHQRDGAAFGNREKFLPPRERGWYREYTVPTPGARDRGARRIVAGRDGTLYYTDDHYRSFKRILE
jgi:ribonuclease T1